MNATKIKLNLPSQPNDDLERLRLDQRGAENIAALLDGLTGIHMEITDKNRTLIASRLIRTMQRYGFHTYHEYVDWLSTADDHALAEFISLLTTNTTQFFRESTHFKALIACLVERAAQRSREALPVDIWCSACSTGQEAYSIAMTATATLGDAGHFKILASDIDNEVLAKASLGVYSIPETNSVPDQFFSRFFTVSTDRKLARVNTDIRRRVEFAEFNLSSEKFPFPKRFDIIFCRNVLIYFDKEAAIRVVEQLTESLTPGGYLFLGHSESSVGKARGIRALAPAFYRKDF